MAKGTITDDRQPSQMSDEELWAFIEKTEPGPGFREAALDPQESLQEQWRILWISLVIPPVLTVSLVALVSVLIVAWFVSQGWYHPAASVLP